MTSVNVAMESLGAVLMAGPAAHRVRLSKRRNVVDIDWVPGGEKSNDENQRICNTSRLFQELQVSIAATLF
jgi:hypothetical protein